jgi:hypothetical protein
MRQTDQPKLEGDLDAAYRKMAQDEEREIEAVERAESMIGDINDEVPQSL